MIKKLLQILNLMRNPFNPFFHQINKYSRSDRNAILILSALILVVLISNSIYNKVQTQAVYDSSEAEKIVQELEDSFTEKEEKGGYFFFFNPNVVSEIQLDSLALPRFVKQNILNFRKAGGKFYVPSDLKKIYGMNDSIYKLVESFILIEEKIHSVSQPLKEKKVKTYSGTFDPNRAGKEKLMNFGFSTFQSQNLLSYRNKGGVFKNKNDLLKIYGIDSVFFLSIEKYIVLELPQARIENKPILFTPTIELNEADSLQLITLNGIGPVYASRIIKYRNLLGGFYSKKQLLEVYNFPEETYWQLENSITVDSSLIIPIRINFAEYNDLLKHPYLNKQQVNALIKFRDKNGLFENISDIELVTGGQTPGLRKMLPYFTCR